MWSSYSLCLLSSFPFHSCIRVCFTIQSALESSGALSYTWAGRQIFTKHFPFPPPLLERTRLPLCLHSSCDTHGPLVSFGPVHPLSDGDSGCVSQVSDCTAQRHLCLVICIQLVFNQRRGESEYLMPRRCWCHSLGSLFQWVWLRVGKKNLCIFFQGGNWFKV